MFIILPLCFNEILFPNIHASQVHTTKVEETSQEYAGG